MNITVEINGVEATIKSFERIEKGMLDLRDLGAWDAVQHEYYKALKDIFANEGGKSGKWKALTPKYKTWKQKKYGDRPILQATGGMYKSMTTAGSGAIVEKEAQSMTLGTSNPKAGWHHDGRGRNPKRPIVDFSQEQMDKIVEPIGKKLRQLIDNAKLRSLQG